MAAEIEARIFLDTNVFVDAVEDVEDLARPAIALLDHLRKRRGQGVVSEITLLEILCKARLNGGPSLHRRYLSLLVLNGYFQLIPVSRDVIYAAAEYRERIQFAASKDRRDRDVIDAIQVASALTEQCFLFVTADKRMMLPRPFRKVSSSEALAELQTLS